MGTIVKGGQASLAELGNWRILAMKEQDLLELYQLLSLYRQTYQEDAEGGKDLDGWLSIVALRYREQTGGKDVREGRNPRNAGRKKAYTEEQDERIRHLYGERLSIRGIAKESGCSAGHVQDVIKKKHTTASWVY